MESITRFITIAIREFAADKLMLRALSLTFGTLLSLLPFLALLFALFKILGGGEWFLEVVRPAFSAYLAPGTQPAVTERLTRLLTNFAAKTVGGVSLLVLLIGLHTIFASVESTFNLIWGGSPRGKLLVRAPIYWGLFLAIPLLIGGAVAATTYIIALPLTTEVATHITFLEQLLRNAIPASMIIVCFVLLYKYLPTAPVQWRSALFGGMFAGLLYEVSKSLFIFYARSFVRYDVVYGSLAMIPLVMIWIHISWLIVLLGMEVAYVFQHFQALRRERKHLHLTRRQREALAIRLLVAALDPTSQSKAGWVNFGKLSEDWELPPGVVIEVVEKLERTGLIVQTMKGGQFFRLAPGINDLRLSDALLQIRTETNEVWRWPNDKAWEEIRNVLETEDSEGSTPKMKLSQFRM